MSEIDPVAVAKGLSEAQREALKPFAFFTNTVGRQMLNARVKEAFTFAFARGFQAAEETSRSCISAVDDAWEEWLAANADREERSDG